VQRGANEAKIPVTLDLAAHDMYDFYVPLAVSQKDFPGIRTNACADLHCGTEDDMAFVSSGETAWEKILLGWAFLL
jgi:hypothetical protein